MDLRKRLMIVSVACLVGATMAVSHVVTGASMQGFAAIEEDRAIADVTRVHEAFRAKIAGLHSKTSDWANWDDTYQFVVDQNQDYAKSNLVPQTFTDLGVDLVLITDRSVKPVVSLSIADPTTPKKRNADNLLKELVNSDAFANPEGTSGLTVVDGTPVLVSIRPILKSTGDGPSRGWLIFGERLAAAAKSELQRMTRQNASFRPFSIGDRSSSDLGPVAYRRTPVPVLSEVDSGTTIGKSIVRDMAGNPALVLETVLNRRVTAFGRVVGQSLLLQVIAVGIGMCLVLMVVVERFVLARLRSLHKQVGSIPAEVEGTRIALDGRDELSSLASQVNRMLEKIEASGAALRASEERLRAHNENLEDLVDERTREIEHQAFHDKLTGLPNRSLFMDRLSLALNKARRSGDGTAVLFIDLDNFKLVNDSLGHDVGDKLLIEVADRLIKSVRPGDTVARLGGDEFTILLEQFSADSEALQVAERILLALRAPIHLGSKETFACASIGVAVTYAGESDDDTLLKNADAAMYRAKAAGKSSFMVFDESMHDYAAERLELETALRKALDLGQLDVAYQPIIDLATGLPIGAEALVRWSHPDRGSIAPSLFIPIAEETGMIIPIGYWVLERACRQAKAWLDKHAEGAFVISVNLSGKQLQRDDVVLTIQDILIRSGLPPTSLKLEITESVLMNDRESVSKKLQQLKELGVLLAIDDFGTGYSSLSTLREFPIDTLKVDRAFVNLLGEQPEALAIVEAIAALAKTMKMDVTGEGIETLPQEDIIRTLGIQHGQGFLYSKALEREEFERLFPNIGARSEEAIPKAA